MNVESSAPSRGRQFRPGIYIAGAIIIAWTLHLVFALSLPPGSGLLRIGRIALHVALQSYLYTGLFITSHDAMHRTISRNVRLNSIVGRLSAFLFAGFAYSRLLRNHMAHHRWPGSDRDPDFYAASQKFIPWLLSFVIRYFTILQLVTMAIVFNVLIRFFSTANVIQFWMLPAFLSTLQLFYFGTYRPHRYPHTDDMNPHKARSQRRNHLFAMLSCYFFGYHYEHHESPGTPWWRLRRVKDASVGT